MFARIMVPIDLEHAGLLEKARAIAADLAKRHDAELVFVGATPPTPTAVAHSPEEFRRKLTAFAEKEGQAHGVRARAHAMISHDPTTDLDKTLEKAVREVGADLVVVGSHHPTLMDRFWSSHGGGLAAHADVSVFVVR